MLRSTTTRSLFRSFNQAPVARSNFNTATKIRNAASIPQLSLKRPKYTPLPIRPTTISFLYATKSEPPFDKIDQQAEAEVAKRKLEPHPEEVSLGSSTTHVFEKSPGGDKSEVSGGMKHDLEQIKETFSMEEVPRDALYIGAAGVIPYAATSLSTVYLAFDINTAHAHGSGYLFSPETAHQLLDYITPIQIGYGAVIISFLGAIHWGMEFAGYGGHHGYRRYGYGVAATAVAWPTIFMPIEYALITQFFAFNFLYFADARASVRGWFPHWYSIYRFVLTFIVGASIVVSLVGRGRIVHKDATLKAPAEYIKGDRDQQWLALEQEEKERRARAAEAADEESEDAEEGEEDSEGDDKKDEKKDDKDEGEDKKEDDKKDDGDDKKGEKK